MDDGCKVNITKPMLHRWGLYKERKKEELLLQQSSVCQVWAVVGTGSNRTKLASWVHWSFKGLFFQGSFWMQIYCTLTDAFHSLQLYLSVNATLK